MLEGYLATNGVVGLDRGHETFRVGFGLGETENTGVVRPAGEEGQAGGSQVGRGDRNPWRGEGDSGENPLGSRGGDIWGNRWIRDGAGKKKKLYRQPNGCRH